ncbi:DUF1109 domain-containing protein [Pseudoduganella albidiflava]|uniref:Uncharacterized protein n=1 Tax=Pseudoduganella albidiflava TaxID=321983 RepID=A0A411WX27_9BURK|nr:DUF1109 domain-containing protein [Pseudoduganella albidiflava]QBI01256.1 hypothetical protein EYF70_10700 [Pseudoduganella albidiflava]GGY49400.1 hypothetical protein GCM10007387_34620 [Pseudoduganella albidiflava]
MVASLSLYLIPYIALFALALRMPGRRSLAAFAVVTGVALGSLAWYGFRSADSAPGGAGLFLLMGTLFICSAIAGLLAGVATRAAMLWRPRTRQSRTRSAFLVLAGFLALPALVGGASWWSEWQRRPPDETCLAAKHHVTIAGADFWLPSAPVFAPWTGKDQLYSFSVNRRMRDFCSLSLETEQPVTLVNLSIDVGKLGFEGRPSRDRFCASGDRDLAKLLCPAEVRADFPHTISVYSPTDYDYRRMLGSSGQGSHAAFVKEKDAAIQYGQPLEVAAAGDFNRYANGYWVARDGMWHNEASEPFTLHCHDISPAGMLHCSTTYRLKWGPQVSYSFRAHQDDVASAAKTVDANFQALMRILTRK